jgi:uncharacterized protein (DUF433 family)
MADTTHAPESDPRDVPAYSLADAARYLGMSKHTLRSWTVGRSYEKGGQRAAGFSEPLIRIADRKKCLLSFFNLAEALVLSSTRQLHGVRMQEIRVAIAYVRKNWPSEHPLLDMIFHTDGRNLFVKTLEETISASERGQLGFQSMIDAYLDRIDKDPFGRPLRIFPLRIGPRQNAKVVVIDPFVSSGQPVIAGTGVPVAILRARHSGGEPIHELAADYGLEPGEIEEALQYFDAA